MRTITLKRRLGTAAGLAALTILGAGCGGDGADAPSPSPAAPAGTTDAAVTPTDAAAGGTEGGEAVVVTAVEYAFEGIPATVAAGTTFSLTNAGAEPHEFVAFPFPEGEERSLAEIAEGGEEAFLEAFGEGLTPATVILAAPGQTDVPGAVVGDGSLTQPGRYAIVCTLPVGAPANLFESTGPPTAPAEGATDPEDHADRGMLAELTVE